MNRQLRQFGILCAIFALVISACGDDGGDDGNSGDRDAAPGDWVTLMSSEWTVPAGDEIYQCVRLTVSEDMFITGFRTLGSEGTHHSVLTVGNSSQPDGTFPCNGGTNHNSMIYGSGIGTDELTLPSGVAMPVRAGQQLLLNLHLYNLADSPLPGTTAIEVQSIPAGDVVHEAETILMGKVATLLIPPGPSTQVGTCTMNGDVTIFTVSPHMHQLGTHMKVAAEPSGQAEIVLHDEDYFFEEQLVYPIAPVELSRGDKIKVHCSYNNTTGDFVTYGDSSDLEMCYATVYRYPAHGGTFGIVCAED